MNKWNLIIDVAECHNCHNCFIGCKDEYVDNEAPGYFAPQPLHGHKWINIIARERGQFPHVETAYVPTMCNHCDDAPCVAAGKGAVLKREDGIVLIDPVRAKGRKDLVEACPYRAIWWNEERQLPQAWPFDAHLLDSGWKEPRCIGACPTGAIKALKIADSEMEKIRRTEKLRPFDESARTRPRVYYKNLHLYDSLFVAGTLQADKSGAIDCIAEAKIELVKNHSVTDTAISDCFGEFKFDGLAVNGGAFELRISHKDCQPRVLAINLKEECIVLDTVILT